MQNLVENIRPVVEFIVFGVLVKYVVARWLADRIAGFIAWFTKHFLINTGREAALWLHYRNKALDINHTHTPLTCKDGRCRVIWPLKKADHHQHVHKTNSTF